MFKRHKWLAVLLTFAFVLAMLPVGNPHAYAEGETVLTAVPDVVGMSGAEAVDVLIAAGLAVGEVDEVYNETIPSGQVISQDPGAGTEVEPGIAVDLAVSMGPAPDLEDKSLEMTLKYELFSTTGDFADGEGTAGNPYLIETPEQLSNVRNYLGSDHADKHFKLNNDIDLNVAPYNQGQGWEPIGTSGSPFAGNFDGDGKAISGLFINKPDTDNVGLLGFVSAAAIKDLVLESVNITGKDKVGGLTGYISSGSGSGHGAISNCSVQGSVTGTNLVGGLVGNAAGQDQDSIITIENCSANVIVSGKQDIGGLVGYNHYGTVTNSYAAGTVASSGYSNFTGGLVGRNNYGTITGSYATASVTGNDDTGGLVGSALYGTVTDCYATGSVTGRSRVGGLAGDTFDATITNCYAEGTVTGIGTTSVASDKVGGLVGNHSSGNISNCYATGNVEGTDNVGGLVGFKSAGTISNTYARGNVSGSDYTGGLVGGIAYVSIINSYATGQVNGAQNVGGLLGNNLYNDGSGGVTGCYYDSQTTEQSDTGKGEPRTTAQMKQQATFNPEPGAGWDFDSIWAIQEGLTYPYLQWQQVDPVPPAPVQRSNPRAAYGGANGFMVVWQEMDMDNFNINIVGQRRP